MAKARLSLSEREVDAVITLVETIEGKSKKELCELLGDGHQVQAAHRALDKLKVAKAKQEEANRIAADPNRPKRTPPPGFGRPRAEANV